MRPNKEEAMSTEPKPQENAPEFPYLMRVKELVEQVFNEEAAALKRSMGANFIPGCVTTYNVRQAVKDSIKLREKWAKVDAPVNITSSALSEAMAPFASLATILTQAGQDEIDPFAVGNILGALCFYANQKTGGYPSAGEYF